MRMEQINACTQEYIIMYNASYRYCILPPHIYTILKNGLREIILKMI